MVISAQQRFWPDPQPLVERFGRAFFRQVPETPGVYLMHGAAERVLYVGKAKNLRHRLGTYRVANPERMARRTLRLLWLVERIVWEECPDEKAALRRESELLRALKPKFNRAGVWPGPKRILSWRRNPGGGGIEFGVTTELEPGWHAIGPTTSAVWAFQHSLIRLLWCHLHPARGLAGMPVGWFEGTFGNRVLLPASPTATETICLLLEQFALGQPGPLLELLQPPSSSFARPTWDEDLDVLSVGTTSTPSLISPRAAL